LRTKQTLLWQGLLFQGFVEHHAGLLLHYRGVNMLFLKFLNTGSVPDLFLWQAARGALAI
jgi:hypothetical protein